MTGADDPLAPPEQVAAFENEMRAAAVLQRAGRPPFLGVDARPVRGSVRRSPSLKFALTGMVRSAITVFAMATQSGRAGDACSEF
jgi:hypothetical protein